MDIQGVGNLVFMPIALAVGRRPVFIFSCALLFIGCIVASQVTNYEYHLAIRIVIGFAAGQSEALVPLMLKEVFFLHERANVLAFQASFQTIVGCVLTIFASNIAASVGWKNWYSVSVTVSALRTIDVALIGLHLSRYMLVSRASCWSHHSSLSRKPPMTDL